MLPIFNFSDEELTVTLDSKYFQGNYIDIFNKENYKITPSFSIKLKPWEYKILVKK